MEYRSPVGLIMNDCLCLIKEMSECNLHFVRRLANKVVHCLAQAASSRPDLGDYAFYPPTFFLDVIAWILLNKGLIFYKKKKKKKKKKDYKGI